MARSAGVLANNKKPAAVNASKTVMGAPALMRSISSNAVMRSVSLTSCPATQKRSVTVMR